MDDAPAIAGLTLAGSTEERLAVLENIVALLLADAAWKARPKPGKPSERDRRTLAEIVELAPNDEPFLAGDLTNDQATAKRYGEALARLRPLSPVAGCEIERPKVIGHRAAWIIRSVGGPEGT